MRVFYGAGQVHLLFNSSRCGYAEGMPLRYMNLTAFCLLRDEIPQNEWERIALLPGGPAMTTNS